MAVKDEPIPPPPWRKQRKASAVRQQLSLDVIIDTALRVLDAEGLAAVSMRRIADELRTGPASLYAYVSNKEELLDLVHDRVIGEIDLPEPDPKRWKEQLRELFVSMVTVLGRHNDIALVGMGNLPTGPNALRAGEAVLAIMHAGGLTPQQAAWGMDCMGLFMYATAYEGSLYQLRMNRSGKDPEEYFGQMREYYESLPSTMFPTFRDNMDAMFAGDGDQRFLFAVDLFLDGLERLAAKRPSRR